MHGVLRLKVSSLRGGFIPLPDWAALSLTNTRKAYWHIAGGSLNSALPNTHWANLGLMSLTNRYCDIRSGL